MASKIPFFTDNMSVDEILNLGDDVLSSLKKRDLSHALRTVALAANKRIKRLLQYSKKRGGRYVEKKNSPGLDLSALNSTLPQSKSPFGKTKGPKEKTKKGGLFSVGNKTRNQIYEELARARQFWNAKTSTVKGALESRKKRERALFGATREEITKGMNKKEKAAKIKEMEDLSSDVYEVYDDYQEEYPMKGGYNKESGRNVIQDIGKGMLEGMTPEEAKEQAALNDAARYEEQQQNEPDFWEEINGPKEEWENW